MTDMEKHKEPRACQHHGAYEAEVTSWDSLKLESRCPECEREREERLCREEEERAQRERRNRIRSNYNEAKIPARFSHCTFDNYEVRDKRQERALSVARAYVAQFKEVCAKGHNLTFCGRSGTGKTHLGVAIAHNLLQSERTVIYRQTIEVIREIRQTWRRDSSQTESEVIEALVSPDLLVLDEVGVQFQSNAERLNLFDILDGRYRARQPTMLISNLGFKDLSSCLGVRLVDRLMESGSAVVVFDWESYRRG